MWEGFEWIGQEGRFRLGVALDGKILMGRVRWPHEDCRGGSHHHHWEAKHRWIILAQVEQVYNRLGKNSLITNHDEKSIIDNPSLFENPQDVGQPLILVN